MSADNDTRPVQVLFKLKDLSKQLGVEQHVLRYWEKEFDHIQPIKIGNRRNLYTAKQLEYFQEVKRLLKNEGYTLAGARKYLKELYSAKNNFTTGLLSWGETDQAEPLSFLFPTKEPENYADDQDPDLKAQTARPSPLGLERLIPLGPPEAQGLNERPEIEKTKAANESQVIEKPTVILAPEAQEARLNFMARPVVEAEKEKLIKELNLSQVKSPAQTALVNWPPNDQGKKELVEELLFIKEILSRAVN
ncbi:MAG: MerR family transcriptional regulator [Deltaproteobacteria bacterium]|jgi:DNA-binding transcriptional MerR regulator|nr:MerR family transcriptional regulator [Deltaproteobacteria bacterium]